VGPNYLSTNIEWKLMIAYAINNRLTPFISMQNQHNAIYREEEREMMPMLKHYGVGTVPWGPIAAGRTSLTFLSTAGQHQCS
jgi:aryl-alcohol dehydrogenase-like predicted oxidoreductase